MIAAEARRTAGIAARALAGCRWTLTIAALAIGARLAGLAPAAGSGSAGWLVLDRGAVLAGQVWRLATGHLAHFTAEHLGWNLLAFLALGAFCEHRLGHRYLPCLLASALAVSAGILLLEPGISRYGGLSGLDSALFTLALLLLLDEARRARRPALALMVLAGAALFAGKIFHESIAGSALFAGNLARAGVVPVPLAHLLGGVAGAGCRLCSRPRPGSPGGPDSPGAGCPGLSGCRADSPVV